MIVREGEMEETLMLLVTLGSTASCAKEGPANKNVYIYM